MSRAVCALWVLAAAACQGVGEGEASGEMVTDAGGPQAATCPATATEYESSAPPVAARDAGALVRSADGGPSVLPPEPTEDLGPQNAFIRVYPEVPDLQYGVGYMFQVAPRTSVLTLNIRKYGQDHWDYEYGNDAMTFRSVTTFSAPKALTRTQASSDADGGIQVAISYPTQPGFSVEQRTGFLIHQVVVRHTLNGTPAVTDPWEASFHLLQTAYNADEGFVVTEDQPWDRVVTQPWQIASRGVSAGIPDGQDILVPVVANTTPASGVSRWRRMGKRWLPVGFTPVSGGYEPSLVRDVDGCLVYSARGSGNEGHVIRVLRSCRAEGPWSAKAFVDGVRNDGPVSVNPGPRGIYVATNPYGANGATGRGILSRWHLNAERTGLGPQMDVINARTAWGAPPVGLGWFVDHPIGTALELSDGKVHFMMAFRSMAFSTVGGGNEINTSHTGLNICEHPRR